MVSILSARYSLSVRSLFLFTLLVFCLNSKQSVATETPINAHALVYSSTAIELFFTPPTGALTQVLRNGTDLGLTDARSLFQPSLDPAINYRYEIRAIDAEGEASPSLVIDLTTANFSLPIKRIDAIAGETEAAPVSEPVSDPTPTSTPSAGDTPGETDGSGAVVPPSTPSEDTDVTAVLPERSDSCNVASIAELRRCIDAVSTGGQIHIRQHLQCEGGDCCTDGRALIDLTNAANVTILGNAKRLLRQSSQRQCSLIDVSNSTNITFNQWHLDDDVSVAPCVVGDGCPRMLHVRNSENVRFISGSVSHGKGYAIYVNQVNGFTFANSALINSGVLGLYVGHGDTASRNVRITDSVFRDNQTNAVALLGVVGGAESNRVSNNVFLRNHRRGQWPVAPQYGTGLTGGGQFYVAQANGVTIENNRILDGYCSNCYIQNAARSGVSGLELGRPNRNSISNLLIRNNTIINHDGFGINGNVGTGIPASIIVENNVMINNLRGAKGIATGTLSNNQAYDSQHFQSFESSGSLTGAYSINTCGGGSVQRSCGVGDSNFGQCGVRLTASSQSCSTHSAVLTGPNLPLSEFDQVFASAWISGTEGSWCFEFFAGTGQLIDQQCRSFRDADSSDVLVFVGAPQLNATAPAGTTAARLVIRTEGNGTSVVVDDIQWSGF